MDEYKFSSLEKKNIKEIQGITILGLAGNVFLSIVKFLLGFFGHSQALIADAIHSVSDLSTDLAVIFGVKVWSKPADNEHPYGHRKFEMIVSGAMGLLLMGVAVGIGYMTLMEFRNGIVRKPSGIAFIGAIISIILKEYMYQWTLKVGKKVKSSAVVANAWHHRTDSLSSIPVAIAIAAAVFSPKWYFLDYLGAFVVSLFVLTAGYKIVQSAFRDVLDRGATGEESMAIEKIILDTNGVNSTHAIRTRKVGSGLFVDLHIQVDPDITVSEGHEISAKVEERLVEMGPDVLDVVVHLEPIEEEVYGP